MSSANAWLLDLGGQLRAAIGLRELLQLIEAPRTFEVPLTPAHNRTVLFWQKRAIPVMDLSLRMGGGPGERKMLALLAFEDSATHGVGLGALVLACPPQRIAVDDSEEANWDAASAIWQPLALSCFEREGNVIPILHLSCLFAAPDVAPSATGSTVSTIQ